MLFCTFRPRGATTLRLRVGHMANRDTVVDDTLQGKEVDSVHEEPASPTYAIYAAPDNGRGGYGVEKDKPPLYRKLFQTTEGGEVCEGYWLDHVQEHTSEKRNTEYGSGYEYIIGILDEQGRIQPLEDKKYAKRYADQQLLTGDVEKHSYTGQEDIIIPQKEQRELESDDG